MTTDVITGIRQGIQDLVAPEIRQLRGDISAIDARITSLEKVMDARFNELNSKMDARLNEFNSRMDARFGEVNAKLDAVLNLHNLEIRLARLEAQKTA
jgi:hypothetical protein